MAQSIEMLGRAVFDCWGDLPRDIQEKLFDAAVAHQPDATEQLAVELHDRHPRTAHPPRPQRT
jgi:hypothetical protein